MYELVRPTVKCSTPTQKHNICSLAGHTAGACAVQPPGRKSGPHVHVYQYANQQKTQQLYSKLSQSIWSRLTPPRNAQWPQPVMAPTGPRSVPHSGPQPVSPSYIKARALPGNDSRAKTICKNPRKLPSSEDQPRAGGEEKSLRNGV